MYEGSSALEWLGGLYIRTIFLSASPLYVLFPVESQTKNA
jgi:hypothetical protein